MKKKIYFMGNFFDYGGYSCMNRGYVHGLTDRGYEVKTLIIPSRVDIPISEIDFFSSLSCPKSEISLPVWHEDYVRIIGHLPMCHIPQDMHNVICTMVESRNIPSGFLHSCNQHYEFCMTPSEYYKNQLIADGFSKQAVSVPIGINDSFINQKTLNVFKPSFCVFSKKPAPVQPEGFKFLSLFKWNFRKGPDVLIKSFLKDFSVKDNVSLLIFSRELEQQANQGSFGYIYGEIEKLYQENANEDSPPIYFCDNLIPKEYMTDVYSMGDCFVLPSRGEGLCLPALEASAMGLPIGVTNITAFKDYCTPENSYSIEPDEYVLYENAHQFRQDGIFIEAYVGGEFPVLGDKAVADFSEMMREMYENFDEAKKKNALLQKTIKEKYTWEKSIDILDNFLSEI